MKALKVIIPTLLVYLLLFASGTQFSACKKTNTIRDTVTVKDTLTVADSLLGLKTGLVGWYTFTNGSLQDSSGNNNTIVFNNAVKTTDRDGRANNAYLFDGASSYMRITNSASLNPANLTLAATIKVNAFYRGTCADNEIIGKGPTDGANGMYLMRFGSLSGCSSTVDTTKEYFQAGYGDNLIVGPGTTINTDSIFIKAGQWYNVVFTYDGYECRYYINGVLKKIWVQTAVFTANSNDVFIGKYENTTYPYYFNGVMDEIRVYNKALSEYDVKRLNTLNQ
ncbi:MAG TPA: LamG domain-containing protein [Chitinophagaceae bacterium]